MAVRAGQRFISAYRIIRIFTTAAFVRGTICGIRIIYTITFLITTGMCSDETRVVHGGDQRGLYRGGGVTGIAVSVAC